MDSKYEWGGAPTLAGSRASFPLGYGPASIADLYTLLCYLEGQEIHLYMFSKPHISCLQNFTCGIC